MYKQPHFQSTASSIHWNSYIIYTGSQAPIKRLVPSIVAQISWTIIINPCCGSTYSSTKYCSSVIGSSIQVFSCSVVDYCVVVVIDSIKPPPLIWAIIPVDKMNWSIVWICVECTITIQRSITLSVDYPVPCILRLHALWTVCIEQEADCLSLTCTILQLEPSQVELGMLHKIVFSQHGTLKHERIKVLLSPRLKARLLATQIVIYYKTVRYITSY